MSRERLPVFEKFIGDLRAVWSTDPDNGRRMNKAKPLLEALVMDNGLKAHSDAVALDRGPQESPAPCR